ncbi:MAG: hypothetical protein C0467_02325 [Planctomycetaceae bacterium]|nr:hypothetical protein [Planctomycetaceae bacterium]
MTEPPTNGFRDRPAWLLAVPVLLLAQVGLGLTFFSANRGWAAVTDDRPILSGRHPLHLYHGSLGAASFYARGTTTCYDPRFQAGFPKTPVFDAASRPAELFLILGGGTYRPAAYKLGLFAVLMAVPLAFVLAARGAGLPGGAAVLAGACGTVLIWSQPGRHMLESGQVDSVAAGLAALVFVPWLARFARTLGIDAWLVLAVSALAGWFFNPFVWLGLTPVVIAYYLVFAPRHGLGFHLGLAGVTFVGITPNVWWMVDWAKFWWLREPMISDSLTVPEWRSLLGCAHDYPAMFACLPGWPALVLGGLIGGVLVWRSGHRSAAALSLLSAVLAVAVARVSGAWPGLPPGISDRLVVLAAGFLILPTTFGAWLILERCRLAGVATGVALAGLLLVAWADGQRRPLASTLGIAARPLVVGFTVEQRDIITVLKQHTTNEARILWDETTDQRAAWNWSALLPVATDRSFLGGLDPDAGMEHSYCGMCDRQLTGRGLGEWGNSDLLAFCRWYNVGWVVARSPAVIERWAKCPKARVVVQLMEGGRPVVLYAVDRPLSFVLAGTATWHAADSRRVVLTNVVPNAEGEVQLSLHMIEGMRAFPTYVEVKELKDPTGRDPIGLIRLKIPGPTPRLTLTWDAP